MDKGELVPDELVVDLIMDRFKEADCANGYVLDGFQEQYLRQKHLIRHLLLIMKQ